MTSSQPPDAQRLKRSTLVTLVLVAGAGTTALVLGRIDPSQREEDVLVYSSPEACVVASIRSEADCRRDYAIALKAYPEAAPRYPGLSECEAHHGLAHCVPGARVAASAADRFVPILAGYLLGRRAEQDLVPQPIYHHRPDQAVQAQAVQAQAVPAQAGHGGGGYCTSWGGRIVTASGGSSSSARVSSAAIRPAAFGGFGQTGRGFFSHGLSSHGGG